MTTAQRVNTSHSIEDSRAVRRLLAGFGFADRAELDRAERYFRTTATLTDLGLMEFAREHIEEWFEELVGTGLSLAQWQAAFLIAGAPRWGVQVLLQPSHRLGPDRSDAIRRALPVAVPVRAPLAMPERRLGAPSLPRLRLLRRAAAA